MTKMKPTAFDLGFMAALTGQSDAQPSDADYIAGYRAGLATGAARNSRMETEHARRMGVMGLLSMTGAEFGDRKKLSPTLFDPPKPPEPGKEPAVPHWLRQVSR